MMCMTATTSLVMEKTKDNIYTEEKCMTSVHIHHKQYVHRNIQIRVIIPRLSDLVSSVRYCIFPCTAPPIISFKFTGYLQTTQRQCIIDLVNFCAGIKHIMMTTLKNAKEMYVHDKLTEPYACIHVHTYIVCIENRLGHQ